MGTSTTFPQVRGHFGPDLSNRPDLEREFLLALPKVQRPPDATQLQHLGDRQLQQTTQRLVRLRSDCGCSAGAVVLAIALAGATVLGIRRAPSGVAATATLAVLSLVAVFVITSIGKLAAILVARARWHVESRNVLRRIERAGGDDDDH